MKQTVFPNFRQIVTIPLFQLRIFIYHWLLSFLRTFVISDSQYVIKNGTVWDLIILSQDIN